MPSLTGPNFPREVPNTNYMMLHWGIVPQALDIIKKSLEGVNTSPMGVQQHAMVIYIRISSEFINTSTLPLN